jgi:hypothetical protein
MTTFMQRLREAKAEIAARSSVDPWMLRLERVRGKIDFDGLECVSSQSLLDLLQVPQHNRSTGTFRRFAKVMAELGWTAVRVRDLTRGGYKEQVAAIAETHGTTADPLLLIKRKPDLPLRTSPHKSGLFSATD